MNQTLKSDENFDLENSKLIQLANELKTENDLSTIESLYYYVRDNWIYDPFNLDISSSGLIASNILDKNRAWCVEKALLLSSLIRICKIPARMGFGIVINHIGTDKLEEDLKRKEIVFHGYSEFFLNNKWVKLTPAFDQRICRLSRVKPMDFNGMEDVLFQEFENGNKFMEYIHIYGSFDKMPVKLMNQEMKTYYPHLFKEGNKNKFLKFKFEKEFLDY
jgi:hypothetical protein